MFFCHYTHCNMTDQLVACTSSSLRNGHRIYAVRWIYLVYLVYLVFYLFDKSINLFLCVILLYCCIMNVILPDEIIRECILPYTYCPQPRVLCEDIQDFFRVREDLMRIYQREFPIDIEHLEWISNDLDRFMNNDVPLMYGYEDCNLEYFLRLHSLRGKLREAAMVYLHNIGSYLLTRDINMRLALLTPLERKQFMEFIYSIYL